VHTLTVHLTPILAAEKGKAPFFIAGAVLVAWALFVSLALGLRNANFPGNLGGQRVVSAISAVLVLAALVTAVTTSGGEEEAGAENAEAAAAKTQTQFGENTPDTALPESATAEAPKSGEAQAPKATTGTPAPPSSPAAHATSKLKLVANPAGQLSYDTKQLSAKAGEVTIDFTNASPVEHDVAIAQGASVAGKTPVFTGGSKTLAVKLKPGTYTFFCTVPGHRQAGMEGTLTVS
jgi:plastocyanin